MKISYKELLEIYNKSPDFPICYTLSQAFPGKDLNRCELMRRIALDAYGPILGFLRYMSVRVDVKYFLEDQYPDIEKILGLEPILSRSASHEIRKEGRRRIIQRLATQFPNRRFEIEIPAGRYYDYH